MEREQHERDRWATVDEAQDPKTLEVKAVRVPRIGLGTWQVEGEECQRMVATALELGYRHVDTARNYGNEDAIGRALRASGVPREQVFVSTKLFLDELSRDRVGRAVEDSIDRLQTYWLDLVMIHWPSASVPVEETLDALHEQQRLERVRHVGVSNFPPALLERAARRNPLLCNQVEYHPFLAQDEMLACCRSLGVVLAAYCPLARGRVAGDETLRSIGERHGRSASQVALRWLLQQHFVMAVPRARSREHLAENLQVFDFELTDGDMSEIAGLARGERLIDPEFAPTW